MIIYLSGNYIFHANLYIEEAKLYRKAAQSGKAL